MELLTGTNFDFLGRRNLFLVVSVAAVVFSIGLLVVRGLNLGIEFAGGTEVELKFRDEPREQELRQRLAAEQISDAQIQRYGPVEDREVLVRVGRSEKAADGEGGDVSSRVVAALRDPSERSRIEAGGVDLNASGPEGLARWLSARLGAPAGEVSPEARTAAAAIVTLRNAHGGLLNDLSEALALPEITPDIGAVLESGAFAGGFILREVGFIGPSAGRELRVKTYWALVGSLIGILIYIWIRFRLVWGLAAIAALIHDVLITLGVMSILWKDFSLPVVAGILMIIGYSLNDTIVLFDRIRENLRSSRVRDLVGVVNKSINQNLSRTLLTSVTTLFVVLTLFLFGGEKVHSFSLALIVGVITGTYSSIFIASPLLLLWERTLGRKI